MAEEALLNLPTDAFVEILLRVPSPKRWLLRRVCRRWRDVIRSRTPAPSRPTPLAFVVSYNADSLASSACAYAIDDLEKGRCREIWRSSDVPPELIYDQTQHRRVVTNKFDTALVGTCNGVLCLCDNNVPGGAVSLVNPASGETLSVPPPPGSEQHMWGRWAAGGHEAYSFAYDPETDRYTVVHVPCYYDKTGGFSAVQVFTTPAAPAAWRDVPAGILSIGGATYWVTKNAESVVSFDLGEERVAFTKALPTRGERGYAWHLANVHGRLGVVSTAVDERRTPEKIEVWVLGDDDNGKKDPLGWSRRYSVQVNGVRERIARPHFAHGDHVLLTDTGNYYNQVVYGHRLKNATRRWQSGEVLSVRVTMEMAGVAVSGMSGKVKGIFSYVENAEPFSAS
ncbi:hypothetical protein EJB05_48522, partial [Eragrostis curvula]